MLKKIALTGLFALAAAFATAGTVSAKTGAVKGKKIEMIPQTKGFCGWGIPMC